MVFFSKSKVDFKIHEQIDLKNKQWNPYDYLSTEDEEYGDINNESALSKPLLRKEIRD